MILFQLTLNDKINMKLMKGKIQTFNNLPSKLRQENSYGVPNSSWIEPKQFWKFKGELGKYHKYLLNKYSDYLFIEDFNFISPAIGYYCNGVEWLEIPNYKSPSFAPGLCWENEIIPKEYLNYEIRKG